VQRRQVALILLGDLNDRIRVAQVGDGQGFGEWSIAHHHGDFQGFRVKFQPARSQVEVLLGDGIHHHFHGLRIIHVFVHGGGEVVEF